MDAGASDHAIVICSRCRAPGSGRLAGEVLRAALGGAQNKHGFSLETVACMAGCERPLAVAFRAPAKASYLFGGIDPVVDASALLEFGRFYLSLPDGWCNESQRPAELRNKTLARIPASLSKQGSVR